MSNFMFADGAAPISDCLDIFLLRSRTGMIYISQRKAQIYHQGNGNLSSSRKFETFFELLYKQRYRNDTKAR
jgi:hypothetical protein